MNLCSVADRCGRQPDRLQFRQQLVQLERRFAADPDAEQQHGRGEEWNGDRNVTVVFHDGFFQIGPVRLFAQWIVAIWKRLSHHISGRRIFYCNWISSAAHHFRHIFHRRFRFDRIDSVGSISDDNWARHDFHQNDRRSDDRDVV